MRASEQALIGRARNERPSRRPPGSPWKKVESLLGHRYKVELLPRTMVRALKLAQEIA